MLLVILIAIVVVLPICLLTSRAKYKARAATLQKFVGKAGGTDEGRIAALEHLNILRESGTLTQEEFEQEKKKILGTNAV